MIPDSLLSICVDLQIAAYFPTLGGDQKATLSFVTQSPDPAAQITHNSQVMLVSREPGLTAFNILGAWADSHDCYYYDEYLDGDDATKEKWVVQKVANTDQPLCYGDQIYLVNSFFQGQRLTRDTRWFQSEWITTGTDGDYWTVEPAEARVTPPEPPVAKKMKLVSHGGSLQFLQNVTPEDARRVVDASPPGGGQNYQPFNVPGVGTWATQDQSSGGQQPYRSADGTASFMWYSCERYPQDCYD